MSNYTPQPNTFSLFANDKGDNPKRPDYKGDIILPDGRLWILLPKSCWRFLEPVSSAGYLGANSCIQALAAGDTTLPVD